MTESRSVSPHWTLLSTTATWPRPDAEAIQRACTSPRRSIYAATPAEYWPIQIPTEAVITVNQKPSQPTAALPSGNSIKRDRRQTTRTRISIHATPSRATVFFSPSAHPIVKARHPSPFVMFEDACCMCGKPTTGSLYCSNACKSQDYYPNLDDTPLLIPSRPQHSLSSSPTSSVMTTLSITDDLPPQVQPSAPAYGTTTAAARTQNSKYTMPLFQPAIQEATSPALAPRKHRPQPTIDVENTLHYVRRAAHQRSASSSTTSLLLSPAQSSQDHASYNEQTMRNMRKQQRASLPAYFSLLETPMIAQNESGIEAWAMPQPHYPKPAEVAESASLTPTVDHRGRSRLQSRSRSRGRTFTRRSSHGAAPLEAVQSVVQRGRSRIPRDLEARAC
ncbi:hypothetical protein RHS01_02396 [Rhizoctonia solani]|uniref:Uncharacterized protein n=1 Tax=Rhizoctonia solani TaxID=456999 RepID=A0A8H7IM81_9AGAM|nr:hypothetical protein RHS01_02396 [Rhizoctonia solani]